MKFYPRLKVYKASQVTFNPETLDAHSYVWWRFVALIDGKVIFNNYRYSNTTSRHQFKVRRLMDQLGIKVDHFVQLPKGIKQGMTLAEIFTEAEETLCDQFLAEELNKQARNERARERRIQKKIEQASKPVAPVIQLFNQHMA